MRIMSLLISAVQVFSRSEKPNCLEEYLAGRPEAGGHLGSAAFGVLDVSAFIAETEVQENLVCSVCINRNSCLELITSSLKRKQQF